MKKNNIYKDVYLELMNIYGPQGWWPLYNSFEKDYYHPGNYQIPNNKKQIFEVMIGTVLTQNSTWKNTEKALNNLKKLKAIDAENLLSLSENSLKEAIKPSIYYNQKYIYLRELAKYFLSLNGSIPERNELLKVRGVGYETADSILLYAYLQPEFVVDIYTKRFFSFLGAFDFNLKYNEIKKMFEENLPRDTVMFNEYHALIVAHSKLFYSKKPYGINDPIIKKNLLNNSCD